jgi:hypothetical protein
MKTAKPSFTDLAPIAFALLGVLAARAVAHFALDDVPHVMDEIAYSLQARTFASGHLTAPLHLPRAAFAMWFVDDRVRTFSIFPPGWPALLALGSLTGLTGWINPLLHGVTTLLVARAARALGGARPGVAATLAGAFYGLSPQAVLLAASLMSHTLVALTAAVVLVAGLRIARAGSSLGACAALGTALGVAAATRPLCAVAIGVTAALFVGIALRRRTLRPAHLAALLAPALALVALLGAYHAHLTGDPLRFPQNAYFDGHAAPAEMPNLRYQPGCNRLGFGPGHGCETLPGGMHTVANGMRNIGYNLTAWLWLAGGGPLAFLLALVALAERRGRAATLERWATCAVIPAVILLYGLYWYAGTCYGARFYHAALPALLVLAALGLERIARRRRLAALATGAVLALFFAWNTLFGMTAAAEISHGYWGNDARFARLADSWKEPPALVLVAFTGEPLAARHDLTTFLRRPVWVNNIRALGALAVNRPGLSGPVVFARYHPGLMPELRLRFPGRQPWLYVVAVRAPDRLLPYEATGLQALEATAQRPPDNFDGFVLPEGF